MSSEPPVETKACSQCKKPFTRDGFATKQWKKPNPSCRRCAEFTKLSQEKSRECNGCHLNFPRDEFDIHQWSKGKEALCRSCKESLEEKILSNIGSHKEVKEDSDGILLCEHDLERCNICMMDFTLPNQYARKRSEVGRELTEDENQHVYQQYLKDSNIHISRKVCIMDGHPVCPRSSQKLRCPCKDVIYCSKACQKHHWTIHKMTCKHAKKEKREIAKGAESLIADLTEEQKNSVRIEAFFAEKNGAEHSIEECAWQLGEHPLVIGGGNVRYGKNGEEFIKGDVAKIYKEIGVEWDGSPRFGLPPYEQQKSRVDWIAKAREGKSQKMKDLEAELMANLNLKF